MDLRGTESTCTSCYQTPRLTRPCRTSLDSFKMGRPAKEDENYVSGIELLTCRWLLYRKKNMKKVKAQVFAQHIKWCNDGLDTFAAMATSVGAYMLIALRAEQNRRGEDWMAVFGDVKT
eukprot:7733628-Heterocapsa_arctica.AAC.1